MVPITACGRRKRQRNLVTTRTRPVRPAQRAVRAALSPVALAALAALAARAALAALLVAAVAACGGSQKKLDAGVYRSGGVAFRIGDVPPDWQPLDVEHATLAYRDEAHHASILLDARCNQKDDDVPLLALTDHLVAGTTAREYATQDTIPFDGREALHSRLTAKLDGVPREYDIFVLKKDSCVYDFVYVAEPNQAPEGAGAFERFVGTFHTVATSSGSGAGT
ncbi:MAG TPA: hypothetical protein VGI39_33980 [Polyangiaceae bacterium]|jgi:hypothetical protein